MAGDRRQCLFGLGWLAAPINPLALMLCGPILRYRSVPCGQDLVACPGRAGLYIVSVVPTGLRSAEAGRRPVLLCGWSRLAARWAPQAAQAAPPGGVVMQEFDRLKQMVTEVEEDVKKAEGGNKAAGTRVRKYMQD